MGRPDDDGFDSARTIATAVTVALLVTIIFNDTTFNANESIDSSYLYYDSRVRYRYDLLSDSRWTAKLGIGIAIVDMQVELTSETQTTEVGESVVLPVAHAHLGYYLTPRLRLFTETDFSSFSGDELIDGNVVLRYDLSHQWDLGLDYRYVYREIDVDTLSNKLDQQRTLLAPGHSF